MKKLIPVLISIALLIINPALDAQKTYKAVCDKSDGRVKIVDSGDRSPNMVPLKGGFPFLQVAENWVKENYPNGNCDPAQVAAQNQAAADAATRTNQAATTNQNQPAVGNPAQGQNQPGNNQSARTTNQSAYFNQNGGQLPAAIPQFRYRNTSFYMSFLFSNLGIVYGTDPPMIPGIGIGIDQVIGTKFYGGTGLHLNTLIGKTDDGAGVSSLFSARIPLFAGFRQVTGKRFWGVELGIAANTMLRPLTTDSHLAGEIAADYSVCTITRAKFGKESTSFEFGVDVWLNDILASEEGFQMTVLSIGYRFAF
jgi:hypothetical protein